MIRAIDSKALELSDEEFSYYKEIIAEFGKDVFKDTFETDEQTGFITLVKPPLNMSMPIGAIFFLFNVMLNQRIREFEQSVSAFNKKKV